MRKVWASGGLWAVDRAVIVATSAVVQIVLARQLGPEGFGGLSYLLALITLFLPFARMGLSGLLVKAMLEKPEQEPRVLNVALTWRLMGVLVSLGVALAIFPAGIAALLALSLLGVALQLSEYSAQARSTPIEVVPQRIALTLIAALLKVYVALYKLDATLVAWVFDF